MDRIVHTVGPYGNLQTLDPTLFIYLQNANFSSEQCDSDEVVDSNVFSASNAIKRGKQVALWKTAPCTCSCGKYENSTPTEWSAEAIQVVG